MKLYFDVYIENTEDPIEAILVAEGPVVEELYQLYVANDYNLTSESEGWDQHQELFCAIESHIREYDSAPVEYLFWELDSNRTEF